MGEYNRMERLICISRLITTRLHQGLKEKVPGKLGRFRKRGTFVVPKYIIVS